MDAVFRNFARKNASEAPLRRNNAKELRAGRIPDGIQEGQKTFLKSLETSATPEYRTYRYGLIAERRGSRWASLPSRTSRSSGS